MSVYLWAHISQKNTSNLTYFSVRYISPWLGPPITAMQYLPAAKYYFDVSYTVAMTGTTASTESILQQFKVLESSILIAVNVLVGIQCILL